MRRQIFAHLTLVALLSSQLPAPAHASAAGDVFTWVHQETGFIVQAKQIQPGRSYEVELTSPGGEELTIDLSLREGGGTVTIDDELQIEYIPAPRFKIPASSLERGSGPVDFVLVRYRGRTAKSPLQLPMLAASRHPSAELPETAQLAQEALVEEHSPSFYRAVEKIADDMARGTEPSRSAESGFQTFSTVPNFEDSGNRLATKEVFPDWWHCVVSAVGWVGSWSCFLSCVTVVGCFACAGLHTVVTTAMVDTCATLAK